MHLMQVGCKKLTISSSLNVNSPANFGPLFSSLTISNDSRGNGRISYHGPHKYGKERKCCVVLKLSPVFTIHLLWKERNGRILRKQSRDPNTLVSLISQTIRERIFSTKFKASQHNIMLASKWNIPDTCLS